MKVALLPKRTRGATVHARLVIRYGDEKSLFGMSPVQSVTAVMLDRGAAGMTREQIRDAFNQLKARVSFQGGRRLLARPDCGARARAGHRPPRAGSRPRHRRFERD